VSDGFAFLLPGVPGRGRVSRRRPSSRSQPVLGGFPTFGELVVRFLLLCVQLSSMQYTSAVSSPLGSAMSGLASG